MKKILIIILFGLFSAKSFRFRPRASLSIRTPDLGVAKSQEKAFKNNVTGKLKYRLFV